MLAPLPSSARFHVVLRALARGLTAAGALLAVGAAGCEVGIGATLSTVGCQDEGAIGPPACPDSQVCRGGQCVPCSGASCLGGAAGGNGGEASGSAGSPGLGGAGQAGAAASGGFSGAPHAGGTAGQGGVSSGSGGVPASTGGHGGSSAGGAGGKAGGSAGASAKGGTSSSGAGGSGGLAAAGQAGSAGGPSGSGGAGAAGAAGASGGAAGKGMAGAGMAGSGGSGGGAVPVADGELCSPAGGCVRPGSTCLAASEFGGPAGKSVCSHSCCQQGDCDPGVACVATTLGGSLCLKPSVLGGEGPGPSPVGAVCQTDSDCVTSLCADSSSGRVCADGCCNATGCAGASCGAREEISSLGAGKVAAYACVNDGGPGATYADCGAAKDCASGLCLPFDGGVNTTNSCSAPCCNSLTDCDNIKLTTFVGPASFRVICDYVLVGTDAANQLPVRTCAKTIPYFHSVSDFGADCAQDTDCRGGACILAVGASKGYCSDACCTDADCSAQAGSSTTFGCRPTEITPHSSTFVLRCLKL